MQLDKLLLDATGALPGAPHRSQCNKLHAMLTTHGGDDVPTLRAILKWFERGHIPGERLFQISRAAAAEGREINLANY